MNVLLCVQDYLDEYELVCIYDLELLDREGDYSRLALPDGENSIWVCDCCGELADPDDGCEFCCEEEDEDD